MANTTTTSKIASVTNGKSSAGSYRKIASTNGTSPQLSTKKMPALQIFGEGAKQPQENDSRLQDFFYDKLIDIY